MLRVRILARSLLVLLVLTAPVAAIGFWLQSSVGAAAGAIAGALFWVFVMFWAEHGIRLSIGAKEEMPAGVLRTSIVAASSLPYQAPRVVVYEETAPNAIVARSFWSRGTVMVSQGLIALLDEQELRAIIRLAHARARSPGIVLQTFCAFFSVLLFLLVPQSWSKLFFSGRPLHRGEEQLLSPASMLRFLLIFPATRFFLNASQMPRDLIITNWPTGPNGNGDAAISALHKIARSVSIWGPTRSPGTWFLCLIDPGTDQMLLSPISKS